MNKEKLIRQNIDSRGIPRKIYKYQPWNEYVKENLLGSKLYFSPLVDLNDPLECRIKVVYTGESDSLMFTRFKMLNPEYEGKTIPDGRAVEDLSKLLTEEDYNQSKEKFGICCFTGTECDFSMWDRYANKNEGICIEYDLEEDEIFYKSLWDKKNKKHRVFKYYKPICDKSENIVSHLLKVEYSDEIIVLEFPKTKYKKLEDIDKRYRQKRTEWSSENECRLFASNHQGTLPVKRSALRRIILGYKMKDEIKVEIVRMINHKYGSKVLIQVAKLDAYEQNLEYIDYCI